MAYEAASFMPYMHQLLSRLDEIETAYVEVLERSAIRYINPNTSESVVFFASASHYGWAPSDPALEQARMQMLGRIRLWRPLFELLFAHPTPEVARRHADALDHLERWLVRSDHWDHSIPARIPDAVARLRASTQVLRTARDLLPPDTFGTRAVVDTNALLDDPDLAAYQPTLGHRYMVHVLPVVLRELDDHKRAGRTPELREAAKRADRRLKGLRDNGDVTVGAKVNGDVWAVFEHVEPRREGLPSWVDLDVPDDRFLASTLLLQSDHPGSALVVVTSDLNLQTKLAAVSLPFFEP
jgi:hypothetical protein